MSTSRVAMVADTVLNLTSKATTPLVYISYVVWVVMTCGPGSIPLTLSWTWSVFHPWKRKQINTHPCLRKYNLVVPKKKTRCNQRMGMLRSGRKKIYWWPSFFENISQWSCLVAWKFSLILLTGLLISFALIKTNGSVISQCCC